MKKKLKANELKLSLHSALMCRVLSTIWKMIFCKAFCKNKRMNEWKQNSFNIIVWNIKNLFDVLCGCGLYCLVYIICLVFALYAAVEIVSFIGINKIHKDSYLFGTTVSKCPRYVTALLWVLESTAKQKQQGTIQVWHQSKSYTVVDLKTVLAVKL